MNRVIQCAEGVLSVFGFFHTSLYQYLEKTGKKNQIDEISFIAFTMQKLRKKTEAMVL